MAIEKGNKVKMEYTGTLDGGMVFDSTTHGDHSHPFEFTAGIGQVIPGFDNAVLGMELNQEKEFRIDAKDAYGEKNPDAVQKIPRDKLPLDADIQTGMMLGVQTPDGRQMPVKIADINDKEITIDMNHPLAGEALNFKIKIVGIE